MSADDLAPDSVELHALVDGQLAPERVEAVLAHLRANPAEAVRVAEWQAQRLALRKLHARTDPGPVPSAMSRLLLTGRRRRSAWLRVAASVLLLSAGVLAGHLLSRAPAASHDLAQGARGFAHEAVIAHAVYTPESRHPVEVTAADEAHLVAWLSRRLGAPLKAPSLLDQGFRLLGGRLLPGTGSPRAQFMYEDATGRRVTLYVLAFAADDPARPAESSFRAYSDGPIESFYWIEGPFGYALTAQLPPADVMALARAVYGQLSHE